MTEPMRILYDYATRYRLSGSMDDCEQYTENTRITERTLNALREQLSETEAKQLEDYLGGQRLLHDLDLEAMFRAGFSIGQELSRQ